MLLPSVCGPCLACSGRRAVGRGGDTPWLSAQDHPSLELSTQDLGRPELCCPDLENGEMPSVYSILVFSIYISVWLSFLAGRMSYQQVGHWAHHCQEGTGLRWGGPGPGASGPCGPCGSGGPSDPDPPAPQRHCQGSPGGPVETFGWRSSWEYWHHFLSFLAFPNLLGIFEWFLVFNHHMCWDSPCIGVRPRSEGKVGGIKRYARLGPEVLKRHKRQGCHWPRKQGGQQLDPNLGLNASGRESEEGEGGGRPVVLLVRISLPRQKVVKILIRRYLCYLPPPLKLSAFRRAFSLLFCKLFTSPLRQSNDLIQHQRSSQWDRPTGCFFTGPSKNDKVLIQQFWKVNMGQE